MHKCCTKLSRVRLRISDSSSPICRDTLPCKENSLLTRTISSCEAGEQEQSWLEKEENRAEKTNRPACLAFFLFPIIAFCFLYWQDNSLENLCKLLRFAGF